MFIKYLLCLLNTILLKNIYYLFMYLFIYKIIVNLFLFSFLYLL